MSASGGAQTLSVSTAAGEPSSRPNYTDLRGSPPVPPPRTSSSHRSRHSFTTGSSSEKKSSTSRDDATRRREKERSGSRREREEQPAAPSAGNIVRGLQQSPQELIKERSTIVNQVIVSDPAVCGEREQARQAGVDYPTVETKTSIPASGGGGENDSSTAAAGMRSRHHEGGGSNNKRKDTNFGQYILGQTLGEGEFGKVKLGWKKDGSVQVAIKMIRREVLGSNPSRLPKIYREISILRGLSHPNIVRLHEMVETDRHIGIIMEYASGGELFEYILNNRYLRDNSARRLFAQLVSGVGYLHKKGIVHRDLKLENLLLDRNRNIIITDFGFANTFDPDDHIDEEVEYNLTNREYVN